MGPISQRQSVIAKHRMLGEMIARFRIISETDRVGFNPPAASSMGGVGNAKSGQREKYWGNSWESGAG